MAGIALKKMLEKLQQFSALTPKPKTLTQSLREVCSSHLLAIEAPAMIYNVLCSQHLLPITDFASRLRVFA